MINEFLKISEQAVKIEFKASKIHSVRKNKTTKNALRQQKDGSLSTLSCIGDFTKDQLLSLADKKVSPGVPCNYQLPANIRYSHNDHDGSPISPDEMVENLNDVITQINEMAPNFIHDGEWEEKIVKVELESSLDTSLVHQYKLTNCLDLYRHKESGNMFDGWINQASLGKINTSKILDSHRGYINKFESIVDIENKTYPFVFISDSLLKNEMSKHICADKYFQGVSLFSDKLNKKIFNEHLTMYDVNYDLKKLAWTPFDGEGYKRDQARLPIIKNGEFVNLITDFHNAKKYSISPTGNAYRDYNTGVHIRPNVVDYHPGKRSFKDITKNIPELIVSFLGAGGDFLPNGDFSTPVQVAYLVKNGEIVGRLPQFQINSNLFDYYGKDLIEIASDSYQQEDPPYIISQVNVLKQ